MTFWDLPAGAVFCWTDRTRGTWRKLAGGLAVEVNLLTGEEISGRWRIGRKGDQEVEVCA